MHLLLEFSLHNVDDPLYNNMQYPLATDKYGKEMLAFVPYYEYHPLVQKVVKELEKLEERQRKKVDKLWSDKYFVSGRSDQLKDIKTMP